MDLPMTSERMFSELSRLAAQFATPIPIVYTTLVSNKYELFVPGKPNRWSLIIMATSLNDTRISWNPAAINASDGIRLEAANMAPLVMKFTDWGSIIQMPWYVRSPSFGSTITWAEATLI